MGRFMSTKDFYEEQDTASEVKTQIVCEYFKAWSQVILSVQDDRQEVGNRVGYVDLFAGKGKYDDGTPSTPIRIAQMAIKDTRLSKRLQIVLNESDSERAGALEANIFGLKGINLLEHEPVVLNEEVDARAPSRFSDLDVGPSLVFLDPWGYAGLSMELFDTFLRNWGTDLIFFFNYNRINAAVSNREVANHMNRLFGGADRADDLRGNLEPAGPSERRSLVVRAMEHALKSRSAQWILNFTFQSAEADRVSHDLFFATKSFKGYSIMNDILSNKTSGDADEPALFDETREVQTSLRLAHEPIEQLGDALVSRFAGLTLTRDEIVRTHQAESGTSNAFAEKHYNQALRNLESEGQIRASSTKGRRQAGTFPNHVQITFPESEEKTDE